MSRHRPEVLTADHLSAEDLSAEDLSMLKALWEDVSPYLASRQQVVESLVAILPRFVDVASLQLYLLDEESGSLVRASSWGAENFLDGLNVLDLKEAAPAFVAPGQGVCWRAVQTGHLHNVPDVRHEPLCTDSDKERGGSRLIVPLLVSRAHAGDGPEKHASSGHRVLGVLSLGQDRDNAFSVADEERMTLAARQVAAWLDYAIRFNHLEAKVRESEHQVEHQTEKLRVERDRADFLHHVTVEMTRTLDLDRVLNRTLARVSQALGVRQGSILLLDQGSGVLIYRAAIGRPIRLPQGGKRTRYERGVGLGGWVLEHNEWAIIPKLDEDSRWEADPQQGGQCQSVLAVPLGAEGEVLGVMLLFHPEQAYFGQDHVALATAAANHITVAVKNAEMYRLIREQAERLGRMLREQRSVAAQRMAILSSIADGVVLADERGHIVVVSEAARNVLRLGDQELVKQPVSVLFAGCPDEAQQAVRQVMAQVFALTQGSPSDEPASVLMTCGERIVEASFSAMLDNGPREAGSQFAGTVIVLRDVTVEQELAQAKTEFVSFVSHELRTPMTSIKGYTDLLLKGAVGELSAQQHHFLGVVRSNVDRMADLVSDLLDMSRIEAGRLTLGFEAVDVAQVVYEVGESVAETIKQRDLTLQLDASPGLPKVHADRNRVIQALLNFVSNAYRYTPAGGTIAVSACQAGDVVQVDVADTGIGISQEDQEKIFDRYYRADHPLVRQQAGTGLGLPIAKSLIEMHGGKLWLQSKVDQGSTFSFTLPIEDAS
jgi:PAS domain S-box-containing protein